jgi:rhodanese-related sulfurtransferase
VTAVASDLDGVLAQARRRLQRVGPQEAVLLVKMGALLVDTRPLEQRERDGEVPGAVVVDRNVLEWRLDPRGAHRITEAGDPNQVVILMCNEGYASSLAAATLQDLGLRRATDVVGGFQAWRAAGMPVIPARSD